MRVNPHQTVCLVRLDRTFYQMALEQLGDAFQASHLSSVIPESEVPRGMHGRRADFVQEFYKRCREVPN